VGGNDVKCKKFYGKVCLRQTKSPEKSCILDYIRWIDTDKLRMK